MIFAAPSTPWLMLHELRLARRGLLAVKGARWRGPIVVVALIIVGAVVGTPAGLALRHFGPPSSPAAALIAALVTITVFTLMLSQSLAAATETLYARGDLDLLLSSPIAPTKVLFAKCAGIAANGFLSFAILVTPVAIPVAVAAGPRWLAIYVVLAALAIAAAAAGLAIAIGLFRLIGPKRTRTVSQLLAVFIGAIFFLVAQTRNLVGHGRATAWAGALVASTRSRVAVAPPLSWPLQALEGAPGILAPLLAISAGLFMAATLRAGRRFGADAAAASGVTGHRGATAAHARPFAAGVFQVTFRKELRLLARDIPLLAQVLLRVLYLLPLLFLLLRNAGDHGGMRLAAGVGAASFVCGQVAGSLVWLTVSAEDAPDLIGSAPASGAAIRRAKLAAALAPLVGLLAAPLAVLLALSPLAGLAAASGCAAAALCVALIGFALQKPAKRSAFRKRGSGSLVATMAEAAAGALVGLASGFAVIWPPLLAAPIAMAAMGAWSLWRGGGPRRAFPLSNTRSVVH